MEHKHDKYGMHAGHSINRMEYNQHIPYVSLIAHTLDISRFLDTFSILFSLNFSVSAAGGLPSLPKFLPPDGTSSPTSSNPELKESLLSVIEKMSEILTDVAKSVHLGTEGMEFVNFMFYNIEMESLLSKIS